MKRITSTDYMNIVAIGIKKGSNLPNLVVFSSVGLIKPGETQVAPQLAEKIDKLNDLIRVGIIIDNENDMNSLATLPGGSTSVSLILRNYGLSSQMRKLLEESVVHPDETIVVGTDFDMYLDITEYDAVHYISTENAEETENSIDVLLEALKSRKLKRKNNWYKKQRLPIKEYDPQGRYELSKMIDNDNTQ